MASIINGGSANNGDSLVDLPIFQALYSNPESLLQFHNNRCMLPEPLVAMNRDLVSFVLMMESSPRIDWGYIEDSLKKLGKEPELHQQSPGVFEYFRDLLGRHANYVRRAARFYNFDLWVRMVHAYYCLESDDRFMAMLPAPGSDDMRAFVRESAEMLAPDAITRRCAEWRKYKTVMDHDETSLRNTKESERYKKRVKQLQKLNDIFDNHLGDHQSHERRARMIARHEHNKIRQEKRNAIKLANMQGEQYQYGREGLVAMANNIEALVTADGAESSARYIADELPDALNNVNLADYPDAIDQMSSSAEDVGGSFNI